MSGDGFWAKLRSRHEETRARKILTGVVMLAEQGRRLKDPSIYAEILRYIDEHVEKPRNPKPAAPRILGYIDKPCSGCNRRNMRLFEIEGRPLCMTCRLASGAPPPSPSP